MTTYGKLQKNVLVHPIIQAGWIALMTIDETVLFFPEIFSIAHYAPLQLLDQMKQGSTTNFLLHSNPDGSPKQMYPMY